MLPIKLTFSGFYSYQQEQTIDFEKLTAAGLFGIFGTVGSGKSSVLEAITFALYGKTERLPESGRLYNMLNLKSNRAKIEFIFENKDGRVFKANREFIRNTKKFNEIRQGNNIFYEKINAEWIPLEHKNAENIIGLSYHNFKRTIIIPQGQFKEFLELGPADRTNMMMEIFNLNRFDLQARIKELKAKTIDELNVKSGQLIQYQEVNNESVMALEEDIKKDEQIFDTQEKELSIAKDLYENLRKSKEIQEKLTEKTSSFEQLKINKPGIDNLELELKQYDKAFRYFHTDLSNKKQLETELKDKNVSFAQLADKLNSLNKEFEQTKVSFETINEQFQNIDKQKSSLEDLKTLREYENLNVKLKSNEERLQNSIPYIEKSQQQEKILSDQADLLKTDIERLKSKLTDQQILLDVKSWFVQNTTYSLQKDRITNDLKKLMLRSEELRLSIQKFPENWTEKFPAIEEAFDKQLYELQQKLNTLSVEKKLEEFAHNLTDGQSCPLCGAIEHPNVLSPKDLSQEELSLLHEQNEVKNNRKIFHEEKESYQNQYAQLKALQLPIEEKNKELAQVEADYAKLQLAWKWEEYDRNNPKAFEDSVSENKEFIEKIKNLENMVVSNETELKKQEANTLKYTNAQLELEKKILVLQNQMKTELSRLTQLSLSDRSRFTDLNTEISTLSQTIQDISQNYNKLQEKKNKESSEIERLSGTYTTLDIQRSEIEKKLFESIQKLMHQLSIHTEFTSLEFVENILNKSLDIDTKRQEIEVFFTKYNKLLAEISTLKNDAGDQEFSVEEFQSAETEFHRLTTLVKQMDKDLITKKVSFNLLKNNFVEKVKLESEKEILDNRKLNMDKLDGLFQAKGFVNYISSIYLRQLCDQANIRFRRMTRNQLSLTVSENNEFQIIDYLNEGKQRSVRTLSGGQAFQVSLALALALAESVQSNAQADKNFFFIDEGFGTQDANSVHLVFETLAQLNKENRIVGIISHVDELKERIPASITVTNEEEYGSKITVNLS